MAVHHVLDDREAQPGAAELSRAGIVDPVESLGQARQMGGRIPSPSSLTATASRSPPTGRAATFDANRPDNACLITGWQFRASAGF